jgi:nitrite reductase/ring-hydroxylating ferredoxin subunit
MAMAEGESVSASLIRRSDLPSVGIVALDAMIDGEMESIIVHCAGDEIMAWHNICPHQGRRLDYAPGKFLVDADRLICAAHGAVFRLKDGECVGGPCRGASLREIPIAVNQSGELVFGSPQGL